MTITFGEKITKLRLAANLSQKKLSELLNASQTCISSWENGVRIPHNEAIKKLIEIGKGYNIEFTIDDIIRSSSRKKRTRIINK